MKIKTVCEATDLTDRAIRHYIEEQLVFPAYTENYLGRRTYDFSECDIQTLSNIAVLRKFGYSVPEIRQMQQDPGCIHDITVLLGARKESEAALAQSHAQILARLEADFPVTVEDLAATLSASAALSDVPAEDGRTDLDDRRFLAKVVFNLCAVTAFFVVMYVLVFQGFGFPHISRTADLVLQVLAAAIAQTFFIVNFRRRLLQIIPLVLTLILAGWFGWLFATAPSWDGMTADRFLLEYCTPLLSCALCWTVYGFTRRSQ